MRTPAYHIPSLIVNYKTDERVYIIAWRLALLSDLEEGGELVMIEYIVRWSNSSSAASVGNSW